MLDLKQSFKQIKGVTKLSMKVKIAVEDFLNGKPLNDALFDDKVFENTHGNDKLVSLNKEFVNSRAASIYPENNNKWLYRSIQHFHPAPPLTNDRDSDDQDLKNPDRR